jgi:ligand-binding SRPBCC domain-containing protein
MVSPPVEVVSELAAPAEEVWAAATDLAQINDELKPLMRMTAPRGWESLSLERIQPGQRLFRSWLLLLGFLPVDYDDLTIAEIGPGHRFQERSRMMSASVWEHERVVVPTGTGSCRLTDRVGFVPRTALHGVVLRRVVPLLFAHRHRRLRKRYGEAGRATG